MPRQCSYAIAPRAPQPCEGPWWVAKDYFMKGKDRNLYACEKHARWRMKLGLLAFEPLKTK